MNFRSTVNGTTGDDFFLWFRPTDTDFFGGNGNDVFNLQDARSVLANGGRGNDRYAIFDGEDVTVTDLWGNSVLTASDTDGLTIRFGGGRDIVLMDEALNFSAKLGAGSDAVSVKNSDGGRVWLEAGADVLKVVDSSNISANGGAGTDVFDIKDSSKIRIGDNDGASKVSIVDSSQVTVTFGANWNNDQVTIDRGDGHVIKTGGGDDIVRVFNPDGSSRYELGGGNDELHMTFDFSDGEIGFLNAGTLFGGRGADTLYVQGYADDDAVVLVELAWRDYNRNEGDRIVFYNGTPIVEGGDVLLHNTGDDGLFSMTVDGPGWQHPDGIGLDNNWMLG